jgi:topoisomerase-4 subunit A
MAYVKDLFNVNFLEYASYVIKDRAIPHIADGLKPVQRRILHSLHEMDDGKFNKVANVVGHCMRYHPHGDQSIISALVVLANKDLFIEKQGNFGNIFTGDEASAARYIECRLTPLAREVLFNPDITEYAPSYDSRNKEPVALPAKVPVLLALGTEGIAVGMATRILPHNLIELMQAEIKALRKQSFKLYPDLPTGGLMEISEYNDGNGKVRVRAKLDTKDPKRIIIREVPFSSTTESLIASIEDATRKGKLKVASIADYTAENVEIEVVLARGVHSKDTEDALYAFTECEQSIALNLLVIKDNKPTIMSVTEVVRYSADQLVQVLTAELKLEQSRLRDQLHAKTLEQIFIENRIYKGIESKKTADAVMLAVFDGLMPFRKDIGREVTSEDVERLLKIPIRRISQYDIDRAKQEIRDINARLKEIKAHLAAIVDYAVAFLEGIIAKYEKAYPRRTKISGFERVDVREAAQRNLSLRYNRETGYLGYEVSGSAICDVSPYDRILVIRKTGTYSVMDAPDKLFVDKGMLHCAIFDKETAPNIVYTLVYRDAAKGSPCLKRCTIEQFILEKGYQIVPDGATPLALTTEKDAFAIVNYKPKPYVRILQESFAVKDYLVKGVKAGGVRLANREARNARFARERPSEADAEAEAKEAEQTELLALQNGKDEKKDVKEKSK